jgi:hypothetical protein
MVGEPLVHCWGFMNTVGIHHDLDTSHNAPAKRGA